MKFKLSDESLLYIYRTSMSIGSWLIFLAIALHISETYGSSAVAYSFLVQGIPPLLFSTALSHFVNLKFAKATFFWLQLVMSLLVLSLVFATSLPFIYVYLFLSSLISTVVNPLFMTMASRSVAPHNWKKVHTRLAAITASTLALAPSVGGLISLHFGIEILYMITAGLFLFPGMAIFLIQTKFKVEKLGKPKRSGRLEGFLKNLLYWPNSSGLKKSIAWWSSFVCLGSAINSIEFFIFEQRDLNRLQIGIVIAFWGLGGVIAFVEGGKIVSKLFSATFLMAVLALCMALFCFMGQVYFLSFFFLIAGYLNSAIAGILRANIAAVIERDELLVWASVNQWTNLINISFYGGLGLMLNLLTPGILFTVFLIASITLFLPSFHDLRLKIRN